MIAPCFEGIASPGKHQSISARIHDHAAFDCKPAGRTVDQHRLDTVAGHCHTSCSCVIEDAYAGIVDHLVEQILGGLRVYLWVEWIDSPSLV